jgi:hypothetical protein
MTAKETFMIVLDRYSTAVRTDPTSDEVITLRNQLVALAGFNPVAQRGIVTATADERTPGAKDSGPL